MSREKIIANILVFFAVIMFGLNVPVLKILMPQYLSPLQASFVRVFFPALLFWLVSFFGLSEKIQRREILWLMLLGGVGMCGFVFFYNLAISVGSPIDVSLMLTLSPIIITLVSVAFLHSQIYLTKILGVVSTMFGAALIIVLGGSGGGKSSEPIGVLYAFIAITFYSGYLLGIRNLTSKYRPVTVLKWVFLSGAIVALALGGWSMPSAAILESTKAMPFLLVGFVVLFPTFLAFLLVSYGVDKLGVEKVSVYQNVIPLVASVSSIMLHQTTLRWDQPVAALFIFAGLYLSSLPYKKRNV